MTTSATRKDFDSTLEGKDARIRLKQIVDCKMHNTAPSYSANTLQYPDNLIPFIDKHMNYLIKHPLLEYGKYIANIKLMTKVS